MIKDGLIREDQCLLGFSRPSGTNGHRKTQFVENKSSLLNKIDKYFSNN